MAEQQSDGSTGTDGTNGAQPGSATPTDGDASGRHAAGDSGSHNGSAANEKATDASTGGDASSDSSTSATTTTASDDHHDAAAPTGTSSSPSESPTVDHGAAAPTEVVASGAGGPSRGVQEAPTAVQDRPRGGGAQPLQRSSVDIGRSIRQIASTVGVVLKVIGYLCALVLIVYILLAVVGVNPQNVVAQTVGGWANVLVLDFRDLFLIPDPTAALVVNYGLAAVCWMVAGEIAARFVRFLGRLVP
jgi:hypothetical protein